MACKRDDWRGFWLIPPRVPFSKHQDRLFGRWGCALEVDVGGWRRMSCKEEIEEKSGAAGEERALQGVCGESGDRGRGEDGKRSDGGRRN